MSTLFSKLRVYAGSWNLVSSVKLDEEDKAMFSKVTVVDSQYGKSACFFIKSGGQSYIPLSSNGRQPEVGEVIDLDEITIETLHRDGDGEINRVKIG